MKTILLKLSGPLQSWGTDSNYETRHTDLYPSKSAIIGMISACLGYRREDCQCLQKLNQLQFAVRIDQQGNILRDYQTAHAYQPKLRTYVTNRYYLEDAVFIVAVGHADSDFIDEVVNGLKNPYFQPFMGRRSDPIPVDFVLGVTESDVLTSIEEVPWQAASWYKRQANKSLIRLPIYFDVNLKQTTTSSLRKDLAYSFSFRNRKYQFREEGKEYVDIPGIEEHDAFGALGG